MRRASYPKLKVFHYEITLPTGGVFDTKYCFSRAITAIAKGRALRKEHAALKVRIENNENFNVYNV